MSPVGDPYLGEYSRGANIVKQAEQPQAEPFVPTDPDLSPNESIKIVPFAKGNRVQVRTVKQEGETNYEWINRTAQIYENATIIFRRRGIID